MADLWRVASKNFVCGVHVAGGRVMKTPPYCRFMKDWTLAKVKKEAVKKDWTVDRITFEDPAVARKKAAAKRKAKKAAAPSRRKVNWANRLPVCFDAGQELGRARGAAVQARDTLFSGELASDVVDLVGTAASHLLTAQQALERIQAHVGLAKDTRTTVEKSLKLVRGTQYLFDRKLVGVKGAKEAMDRVDRALTDVQQKARAFCTPKGVGLGAYQFL